MNNFGGFSLWRKAFYYITFNIDLAVVLWYNEKKMRFLFLIFIGELDESIL